MKLSSSNSSELFQSARLRVGGFMRWMLIQGNAYLRLSLLLLVAIVGVIVIVNALYGAAATVVTTTQSQSYTLDTDVLDTLELWIEERHDQLQTPPSIQSRVFTRS